MNRFGVSIFKQFKSDLPRNICPGNLIQPLVCSFPYKSTMVLYFCVIVTLHQFYRILLLCRTCLLCHVELVEKVSLRGSN